MKEIKNSESSLEAGLSMFKNLTPILPFQPFSDLVAQGYSTFPKNWNLQQGMTVKLQMYMRRDVFCASFGYVLATAEVMERLVELFGTGRVLDAGSGSGYLAHELASHGVHMLAVDHADYSLPSELRQHGYAINKVYRQDVVGDAVERISSAFNAVLLTWPNYDSPFAFNVAKAMLPGQILVYEGEGNGGCNANNEFFELLTNTNEWTPLHEASQRLNEVHCTFHGINDHWSIWLRNGLETIAPSESTDMPDH